MNEGIRWSVQAWSTVTERIKIGESGRQYTVRTNRHGIDYVLGRLRDKKTVKTLALFWRIPHRSGPDELSIKIGRYQRVAGADVPETANPKSELTLDFEELQALQQFMSDNVGPLSSGASDYMVLDDQEGRRVELLRKLLSDPDQEQVLDVLTRERLVPDDLRRGLEHRARCAAVEKFEQMLDQDLVEADWQRWFQLNDWVLGSDFVRIVDERPIDIGHIADYLMEQRGVGDVDLALGVRLANGVAARVQDDRVAIERHLKGASRSRCGDRSGRRAPPCARCPSALGRGIAQRADAEHRKDAHEDERAFDRRVAMG